MSKLKKILEKLSSLETKVETAKFNKSKSNPWAWIVTLLVGAAISIGAALLFRQINKRNKELAKLRTEAEQSKVKSEGFEFSSKVAEKDTKQKQLKDKADKLKNKANELTKKIDQEQAQLELATKKLMEIKTWKELDLLKP